MKKFHKDKNSYGLCFTFYADSCIKASIDGAASLPHSIVACVYIVTRAKRRKLYLKQRSYPGSVLIILLIILIKCYR